MAALDSTRLKVLQNMQTTLQAMRVANGYHWDVKASSVVLDPVTIEMVPPSELPFFILHPGRPGLREYLPAGRVKDTFEVTIIARQDATGLPTDLSRKVTVFESLVADLERALAAEWTRGGLAVDTRVNQPEEGVIGLGNQNMVVLLNTVDVRLRHVYGHPETY